ncbi:hypothetical protein ACTWLT_14860 [Micromonospora sp. ZYX-F-536]
MRSGRRYKDHHGAEDPSTVLGTGGVAVYRGWMHPSDQYAAFADAAFLYGWRSAGLPEGVSLPTARQAAS